MEAEAVEITWESFKREYLGKYFPKDVRNRKEVEFLELKQGNVYVAEADLDVETSHHFISLIHLTQQNLSSYI